MCPTTLNISTDIPLTDVAKAAQELMGFLQTYVGHNEEWPIKLVCNIEMGNELSLKLQLLRYYLEQAGFKPEKQLVC